MMYTICQNVITEQNSTYSGSSQLNLVTLHSCAWYLFFKPEFGWDFNVQLDIKV